MKHVLRSFAALALAVSAGCAAAAIVGTSVIITEEFQDNALTATIEEDVDVVWASAKSSLANMTTALIHWDDDHRAARTRIDNAVVVVEVRNWDVDETQLRVAAKKVLVYNHELAQIVQRRIVKDLTQQSQQEP